MKRFSTFIGVAVLSTVLFGCEPIERTAYDIVVTSKASLVSFRSHHPECAFNVRTGLSQVTGNPLCAANNKLTSAKDLIIDAAIIYCAGAQFESGGTCNPPSKGSPAYQQAYDKLSAAIAGYDQTAADLKGVIQ